MSVCILLSVLKPLVHCPKACLGTILVSVKRLQRVLHDRYEHAEFRPGQLDAAIAVLHGHDVFVRMSTGGGKSLCMFLPPLAISSSCMGVIISPLNCLMDEQIMKLESVGVRAIRVTSKDANLVDAVERGSYQFVFMSPETAICKPWRELFGRPGFQSSLTLVAVDEAHCITEWGTDFRKAFGRIGGLRALTKAPFMSLTASAPPLVEADIKSSLYLQNPVCIRCPLNRPNIYLSVNKKSSLARDLSGVAASLKACSDPHSYPKTVIFCGKKETVCNVYEFLRDTAKSSSFVTMYHASISDETKEAVYSNFVSGSLCCLVSTIAFGMVGFFILPSLPSSHYLIFCK